MTARPANSTNWRRRATSTGGGPVAVPEGAARRGRAGRVTRVGSSGSSSKKDTPRSGRGRIGQYYRSSGRVPEDRTWLQLRRRPQGPFFPRGRCNPVETAEHPTTTATNGGTEVVLDRYRLMRRLGGGGF